MWGYKWTETHKNKYCVVYFSNYTITKVDRLGNLLKNGHHKTFNMIPVSFSFTQNIIRRYNRSS